MGEKYEHSLNDQDAWALLSEEDKNRSRLRARSEALIQNEKIQRIFGGCAPKFALVAIAKLNDDGSLIQDNLYEGLTEKEISATLNFNVPPRYQKK